MMTMNFHCPDLFHSIQEAANPLLLLLPRNSKRHPNSINHQSFAARLKSNWPALSCQNRGAILRRAVSQVSWEVS